MKKRVAVVADDITGANDIGVMFAKNGCTTGVFPWNQTLTPQDFDGLDVVILDTDSRFDTPAIAAQKVAQATALLLQCPFSLYFNKTCSVFRGNIGAEFDAMQDVLGETCSMVIAGFPKNGRTTMDGVHYLNGDPLDKSALINDPVHPTTEPILSRIIGKQSSRTCGLFSYRELELPLSEQRRLLEEKRSACRYLIFDVRDQQDLKTIAALVAEERNICGSSAIGEELPKIWGADLKENPGFPLHSVEDACGTLVLAGSLTKQTAAQITHLQKQGIPHREIDTLALFDPAESAQQLADLVDFAVQTVRAGQNVLIHTANNPDTVARTKQEGYRRGLGDEEIGKLVSGAIHHIAKETQRQTGLKKLVVAGGDTSAAVSTAFSLKKMLILKEIEPGVPTMYGYGNCGELLLVFKSGSFGSPEFLEKAMDSLNRLQQASR